MVGVRTRDGPAYLATTVVPVVVGRSSSQRLGRFGFDCMRCLRGSRSITRIHSWTIIASPPDDGPFGTRDLIGPDGSVVVVLVASVGDNGIMLVVEK